MTKRSLQARKSPRKKRLSLNKKPGNFPQRKKRLPMKRRHLKRNLGRKKPSLKT